MGVCNHFCAAENVLRMFREFADERNLQTVFFVTMPFEFAHNLWQCQMLFFPRDPGSPSENGFMEPKYLTFRR